MVNCTLSFFKVYTVGGLFGKATDDFSDTGKLVEKTTFGKKLKSHVFLKKLRQKPQTKNTAATMKGAQLLLSSCFHTWPLCSPVVIAHLF